MMYVPQNCEHVFEKLVVLIRQIDNTGLSPRDMTVQSNDRAIEELSPILAISYFTY